MRYPALTCDAAPGPRPCPSLPGDPSGPHPGRTSPDLFVTRLGPDRWRIAARLPDRGLDLVVFLAPAEGSVVRLKACGEGGYAVAAAGNLGEAGAANLGDCLLEALERGAARLGLEVRGTTADASIGASAVLESFGRLTARLGGRPSLAIGGVGQDAQTLRRAFARGAADAAANTARRRRP